MQYNLTAAVTAGTGVDQIQRVLVVIDGQPNGVAPGVTDVLSSASPNALPNISYRKRFKILMDKTFFLNASGEAGSTRVFTGRVPVNSITYYNAGSAGTVADIATNSLYLITVGSQAAGATAGSLTGTVYTRFYDE